MKLIFNIDPVAKARPRLSKFGVYTPKKTKNFEKQIRSMVGDITPLSGPVAVHVTYYIKRPKTVKRKHPIVKPDLDNYDKAILDALNGLAYQDDAQIVRKLSEKCYDLHGRIVVELWTIE